MVNIPPAWKQKVCNFNCDGLLPFGNEPRTAFADYDDEGFDSYGYSAFDVDGTYVGLGYGVDRLGVTAMQYMEMSDDEFECV